MVADDVAAPLFYAYVVIAVVVGVEVWAVKEPKHEAHLRVAHSVAALLAVMRDGDRRETLRAKSSATSTTSSR